MENRINQDFLHFGFLHQYGKSAQLGDEIEYLSVRYRLMESGWIDVVKSSPDLKPKKSFNEEMVEVADHMINLYKPIMKKQIEMSLETARNIYKDVHNRTDLGSANFTNWLLENFTKEELEGKKGFTWEESFNKEGFTIEGGKINHRISLHNGVSCKEMFKTKEQAESALAFAQLSHIVPKYNEGKGPRKEGPNSLYVWFYVYMTNEGKLSYAKWQTFDLDGPNMYPLMFNTREAIETSMEVNKELWVKYLTVNKNEHKHR